MNIPLLLNEIAKADPEFGERISPRRSIIKNFSSKVALAALPLALGGLFKKAYGKPNDVILDTLMFILKVEHLETSFYTAGLGASGLIPNGQDRTDLTLIRDNEMHHRDFIRQTIIGLGGAPPDYSSIVLDFTGGAADGTTGDGPFNDVLTSYATFLGVAQSFENTGVRGLKGSAGVFAGNDQLLTDALGFHSVEGRHAAHIQMMRRRNGHAPAMKPWITNADSMIPGAKGVAAQPTYDGEQNTIQATVNIAGISGISQAAATEAFDEPINAAQFKAIASNFIVM